MQCVVCKQDRPKSSFNFRAYVPGFRKWCQKCVSTRAIGEKHLVQVIVNNTGLSQRDARNLLKLISDEILRLLENKYYVKVPSLGYLYLHKQRSGKITDEGIRRPVTQIQFKAYRYVYKYFKYVL